MGGVLAQFGLTLASSKIEELSSDTVEFCCENFFLLLFHQLAAYK